MISRLLVVVSIFTLTLNSFSQTKSTIKEYKQVFTTYPYSDPDPVPALGKIYPYFRFDGFTEQSIQKEWKVVELENDFIKVMILPEIGGKIWAAIEKSTNRPFIYYNHAVKFRDVAMRGPWTSGGIEANYGIIGHTPNSASPVDYMLKQKDDGSVSCYISWLDLLTRTNWSIEINLPDDKAYFTTHSTWYNNTPTEQPYYHWMNVGIKTKGNLQFIYPGTKYIGHEGEHADWPVNKTNNKRIDFYEQNNFGGYKSYHVFGKYTDFFGAYWHDDDFGMARYSLHDEKPGKKIWIWGLSQQGMIWEKLLTDTDGQYAEIQSGRLFNQNDIGSSRTPFKHISFEPYATDEWTEYWYPVLHTKGFVKANEYGALNTRYENGWLKINFSPVQNINELLLIRTKEKIIYSKSLQLTPLKTFQDSIRLSAGFDDLTISIGDEKFDYHTDPATGDLARPVDAPANFDWTSAYGNYIGGKEFMDQRLYARANEKLQQSLKLDSNFLPALTLMAELCYHNMEYEKGLALASRALSIDTHDGAGNYYYGVLNAQLGRITDAKDGFDLAALLPSYRAAAYTALAKLYLTEKHYGKAKLYADKALYYNAGNMTAYKLKAIIARKSGNREEALRFIKSVEQLDPLNHFSSFEKWLWTKEEADKKAFSVAIQQEMVYQTYLELSIEYYNLGCLEEATKMLELAPDNALINYWKAFINYKLGKPFTDYLSAGDKNSPAFVLPFRSESAEMLKWVATQTSSWNPKYYLALLYHDRNRFDECLQLMKEIGDQPTESFFYAARAGMEKDENAVEKDLLRANELDKNEWRYIKKLAEYYLDKQDDAKALALTAPFYKAHTGNYIIGLTYSKVLLANKRYVDAGNLLTTLHIIPFEGATDGRELYREAMIGQAVESMQQKKFARALERIGKAKLFPENLGSGTPYDEDINSMIEDYLTALCYAQMNKKQEAVNIYKKLAAPGETKASPFSNSIIQAWALQKLGDEQAAADLISTKLSAEKERWLSLQQNDILNHTIPVNGANRNVNFNLTLIQLISSLQK